VRWLLALIVVAGCSRASDESKANRAPKTPPPPGVKIPADLHIEVTVDGVAGEPITAARLDEIEPDFHDDDRRAWKLTHLIPGLDHDGAWVEARGPSGISIRVDRPSSATEPQPVLYLTRRGEVVVSVLDPGKPFPEYHGQGGQLRRPGDPLPRLSPVASLTVGTR